MNTDIIKIVDQQIFSGRQAKTAIDSEYYASRGGKTTPKEYIPILINIYNTWQQSTVDALRGVVEEFYISQFIHAQPSIFITEGDIQWNNIRNKLQAQLDELISLRKSLEQPTAGVNISIAGEGNKAMVGSVDASINIVAIASHLENLANQFDAQYDKPDKEEVRGILDELKQAVQSEDATKVRSLGGVLLTRVSEFAVIAGLVLQLIQMFSK